MKNASDILAANILLLFEETARSANDVGTAAGIGQTTVSSWLRKAKEADPSFNPRLSQLSAFARVFGYTVADLFSENLGRPKAISSSGHGDKTTSGPVVSAGTHGFIKRLQQADFAGTTSPELFRALEAVLDLVQPPSTGSGYDGLNRMPAE